MSYVRLPFIKYLLVFQFCLCVFNIYALRPQELDRLVFQNETGYTLVHLFARLDNDPWSVDLLSRKEMKYGSLMGMYVHYKTRYPKMAWLAVDSAGRVYDGAYVQLGQAGDHVVEMTVRNLNRRAKAPPTTELYLNNSSGDFFSYLFFAPLLSASWGFDLLDDSSSMESGSSRRYRLYQHDKTFEWEVLIITRRQSIVQRRVTSKSGAYDIHMDILPSDLNY